MTLRALVLASHYHADHERAMRPYRRLNPAASSWNTALFAELGKLDIELHIVQFWPVRRYRRFVEGRVTHHYLPKLPWLDNFTSIFKRQRVRRLVRELSPDVVHGIGSEHGYAWAAIGHGVPSIITIHGWLRVINTLAGHTSLLKRWFLVREEAQALRQADRVIAINEYMRDRFVNEGGCALERTVVIPNALNPVYLQDWSESPRPIDIIMVGTLQPLKNQHVALELFHRLARDHGMHPRVVIVGAATVDSTDYRDRLHAMREEMGLTNVEFVGKKSPAELFDLYLASRFLLHISEFEADPTVVAEALACGTLPIVNPVAGLAYRVQDGFNGWHLPIASLDGAATRLAAILPDKFPNQKMAANGHKAVVDTRRPTAIAQATLRTYEASEQ